MSASCIPGCTIQCSDTQCSPVRQLSLLATPSSIWQYLPMLSINQSITLSSTMAGCVQRDRVFLSSKPLYPEPALPKMARSPCFDPAQRWLDACTIIDQRMSAVHAVRVGLQDG